MYLNHLNHHYASVRLTRGYSRPIPPSPLPRSDSAAFALMCAGLWDDRPEPVAELPPQVDVALALLRKGYSEIEVRLELQQQYGTSARPNQAFSKALALLVEEERRMQPVLHERVQAIRFHAIQQAMRDRAWGAVAKLLSDAAPPDAVGEGEGVELAITIESSPAPGALGAASDPTEGAEGAAAA